MRPCEVDGCTAEHAARGYCNAHYARLLKYGDPRHTGPRQPKPRPHRHGKVCTFEGCTEPYAARGMCARHYHAAWKYVHHAGSDWARATELAAKLPPREGVA